MNRLFFYPVNFFLAAALVVAAGAGSAGCAAERVGFRPTTLPTSNEAGFPASRYAVPPESPRGEVFVTSFGTRDVDESGEARSQLIHVRVAIANQSGSSPWTFEPSRQVILVPGAAPQPPSFLEIDGKNPGDAHVAPTQKKVFDLYYRMPSGGERSVPTFDVSWQVLAEGRTVSERTSFVREPYRDYSDATRQYWAVGVMSPWWISWYGTPWLGWYGPWGPGPYWGGPFGFGYAYGYHHGYYGNRFAHGGGGSYAPRSGGGGWLGGGRAGGGGLRVAPAVRGRAGGGGGRR